MKKKSSTRVFKTVEEMDRFLDETDLSEDFKARGKVKSPLIRKINLDLPEAMISQIDAIAEKMGVSRQPLLKVWIFERLKQEEAA